MKTANFDFEALKFFHSLTSTHFGHFLIHKNEVILLAIFSTGIRHQNLWENHQKSIILQWKRVNLLESSLGITHFFSFSTLWILYYPDKKTDKSPYKGSSSFYKWFWIVIRLTSLHNFKNNFGDGKQLKKNFEFREKKLITKKKFLGCISFSSPFPALVTDWEGSLAFTFYIKKFFYLKNHKKWCLK